MKKLFIIFLGMTMFLPLYAQEAEINEVWDQPGNDGEYTVQEESPQEEAFEGGIELAERQKRDWARQRWEFGTNIGVGFDNDILGTSDVKNKSLIIDVNKIAQGLSDDGAHVNFDLGMDVFFLNIKNLAIGGGIWDFGFFISPEVGVGINIPKSLFTVLSEGNLNQKSFDGLLSVSGSAFVSAGFSGAAQYEVGGRNLRVGLKPTGYYPMAFIPKSGVKYHLDTDDKIVLDIPDAEISIYTFMDGEPTVGVDLTWEGEYALLDFLDVGGSFAHPFVPATFQKRTYIKVGMEPPLDITLKDLTGGEELKIPEFTFDYDNTPTTKPINVFRPLRFDVYALYRPLETQLLTLKPNMGFSVDLNEKEGYFNTGFEVEVNLNRNMFMAHLGSGYEEASWKHRLGFIFNVRAFEMHLEACLRSPNFAGAFQGQGFGVNLGWCFGW